MNGRATEAAVESPAGAPSVRPRAACALSGTDIVEIAFDPAPEILPPDNPTRAGELDRGLKIVRSEAVAGRLKIGLEGLAGRTYKLDVLYGDLIASAEGADFDGRSLTVRFPDGPPGEFLRRAIELILK